VALSTASVKRPYDVSRRRARSADARRRVLDAARRRFLAEGYAATTVPGVAAAAGVSVEWVYKAVGRKPQLALAVFHDAIAGPGAEPTELRADRVSAGEADPRRRLLAFGAFVAEVTPRVAPLLLLVRDAAAADGELAAVWEQMLAERLARMATHAARLAGDGHLREGVTVDEARDVLWLYSAPELYDLMVRRRGWSAERFGAWVGETYVATLLPGPTGPPTPAR
jgi:AcrR family transcriptional regulator